MKKKLRIVIMILLVYLGGYAFSRATGLLYLGTRYSRGGFVAVSFPDVKPCDSPLVCKYLSKGCYYLFYPLCKIESLFQMAAD